MPTNDVKETLQTSHKRSQSANPLSKPLSLNLPLKHSVCVNNQHFC